MGNEPGRQSRALRVAEFLLTLGLGASLVVVAPHLWTRPAQAPASVAPAPPVITPLPPPRTVFEDAVVVTRPVLPKADAARRVILANRGGIHGCVQRWLLRGHGAEAMTIDIKLNIGISGRVKHVQQVSDPRLRALDPCIREVVSRWAFPQNEDEYGVDFVLTMHTSPAD